MSHQNPDAFNELDDELQDLFARATDQIAPRHDIATSVQQRLAQGGPVWVAGEHRSPTIVATLSAFLVVALLAGVFLWFGPAGMRPGANGVPTPTVSSASTPVGAPLTVMSVDLSVTPTSIAGTHCGTSLTVTYTALFHLRPKGPGGTIQFEYTIDNGRSSSPASITVAPGQTAASYTFRWSGNLPADHTYPEQGGVIVHSPNVINSSLLGPSGTCS